MSECVPHGPACPRCGECRDCIRETQAKLEQARKTAEYWKAEHLAGNAEIARLAEKALAYDLDCVGIARRDADAVALIECRAEIVRLRAELATVTAQRDTAYGYGRDGGEPPWLR
jgi:polyferredoxin